MKLLFTRQQWEKHPAGFNKEQLDNAENRKDGFIGYWDGVHCYLWKFIKIN